MKEYVTISGEVLLFTGQPNLELLEELSKGAGDVWHSSMDHGFKNIFPELIYQTALFWWFLNDIENVKHAVNWRVNAKAFVVRKSVWEKVKGFDSSYNTVLMQGLDFGYQLLRYQGGVPMYVKGLFALDNNLPLKINVVDRYRFFRKHFAKQHLYYMFFRKGIWYFTEWKGLLKSNNQNRCNEYVKIAPRQLNPIQGNPNVSYVLPTMLRQEFTLQLLHDLEQQTYPPSQVVVVDATPVEKRIQNIYNKDNFSFQLIVKWQETKGSCRARNEAIELCNGDYIIFGDDDICISEDFIEKHIQLLQTYNAEACNGLDIKADHPQQKLSDLFPKLEKLGDTRWFVGCSPTFSNANSCVKKEVIDQLIGNDVNFDGGYGEDSDFGFSILKMGKVLLHNPFSANLHLKPVQGGYRFWGAEAKKKGKLRKTQPWELDIPVKNITPVPSPTITYGLLKHYPENQFVEYTIKHFLLYLIKGKIQHLPFKIFRLPYKILQFKRSVFYAKKLIQLGVRYK
ncbi:glycosyltransferase family 2 protein [Flavobacterium oreochromis]|uniref:Family 2 glycosyl transferase n=2 Tax=Flavobacterium TaxID=237 RepID=A0A246GE27_9FLAO|nr:glycosyltransferase [Flavobacterium oreochromis]OWP76043.1 family 2 glycosyl transferase [Flavobacterium oreochromis]OWP79628.1 family 2 glycosyl transferase [Flavobacterium oreochromis]QYS86580.1 glycosyltransferase [Flavobacterium oreochromis]